jgi:amino acid transporter
MMVWDPSAGGFIEFSSRYIDPAMGFAMGWQYWFQVVISAPVEITAASIVVSFWDTNDNHKAIYITVMLIGIILVNLAGVKYFGEFEFGKFDSSTHTSIVDCGHQSSRPSKLSPSLA